MKYYHYGYRFIKDQGEEDGWEYVIQAHRNQNGLHFDTRLAKPGNQFAYSWASRKMPITPGLRILARRTHDHSLDHLNFEGPLTTAKGRGTVKILRRGKAKIKSIDNNEIIFKTDTGEDLILRNLAGKKYIIERT